MQRARVFRRSHEPAPPTRSQRSRARRKVNKAQESRQPREGPADLAPPQHPATRTDRDVDPARRVRGSRAISKRERRGERENALEGGSPGRHRRIASERTRWTERARVGIKALKSTAFARSPWGRGDVTRATPGGQEAPERGPDRREENALKGEAEGRSDAARRREGRWWTSRRRYPNLARGTARGWTPRAQRIHRPGTCRTAPKPRGGSIVRRVGFGRRDGAGVLRWTSEGKRKHEEGLRTAQAARSADLRDARRA